MTQPILAPFVLTPEQLRQGLVIEVPPEGAELPPITIAFRGGPLRIERLSIVGDCRPFLCLGHGFPVYRLGDGSFQVAAELISEEGAPHVGHSIPNP